MENSEYPSPVHLSASPHLITALRELLSREKMSPAWQETEKQCEVNIHKKEWQRFPSVPAFGHFLSTSSSLRTL